MNPSTSGNPNPQNLPGDGSPFLAECRQLLSAWLELEQSRRALTANLFEAGQNQERIRDLLDQVDRRSEQLLSVTTELLKRAPVRP